MTLAYIIVVWLTAPNWPIKQEGVSLRKASVCGAHRRLYNLSAGEDVFCE